MSGSSPLSSPPAHVPPAFAWRSIAVLGGFLFVTQVGFYLMTAALPLYLHDLGAARGRIGFEVGLGSLTGLAATLAIGPAMNRVGARRFLALGAALYVLSAAGMLLFPQEGSVAALRALQGFGSAALMPAAMTLAAELAAGRPATALGTMGSINSLGLAVGPPVGLALYSRHGRVGLFLPAALASALGLALVSVVPGRRRPVEAAPGFGLDRSWFPSLLVSCAQAMYFGGILAYLPLDLRQLHGPNAGIFFTADALGVLLLRLPTGLLADRRGSRLPKLLGVALTLPGIGCLALPPSVPALIAAGALTGIGAGLAITGVMVDLSGLSWSGNRGTAMSLGTASFSAGIFVGSTVSGLLIGPGGFDAVLLFGGLTTLISLPFVFARGYHPDRPAATRTGAPPSARRGDGREGDP